MTNSTWCGCLYCLPIFLFSSSIISLATHWPTDNSFYYHFFGSSFERLTFSKKFNAANHLFFLMSLIRHCHQMMNSERFHATGTFTAIAICQPNRRLYLFETCWVSCNNLCNDQWYCIHNVEHNNNQQNSCYHDNITINSRNRPLSSHKIREVLCLHLK